jgi:hypothetical protein
MATIHPTVDHSGLENGHKDSTDRESESESATSPHTVKKIGKIGKTGSILFLGALSQAPAYIHEIPRKRRFVYAAVFSWILSFVHISIYVARIPHQYPVAKFFAGSFNSLMYTVSPYALARYCFPDHKLTAGDKALFAFFTAVLVVVSVASYFRAGGLVLIGVNWIIQQVWFGVTMYIYRNSAINANTPETYIKYVFPVVYVITIVKIAVEQVWEIYWLGSILLGATFVYMLTVIPIVITFDRVVGAVTPPVLENQGYYFSALVFVATTFGSALGMLLVILRPAGILVITAALQLVGLCFMFVAVPVSKRCTDKERYQPLLLQLYIALDMMQSFMYLRSGVSILDFEFITSVILQQLSGLLKFGGVAGILVPFLSRGHFHVSSLLDADGLRAKGIVSMLSSVMCCWAVFACFVIEVFFRETGVLERNRAVRFTDAFWEETSGGFDYYYFEQGDDGKWGADFFAASANSNNTVFDFNYTVCATTCVGWNIVDATVEKPKSVVSVWLLFFMLSIVHVAFLLLQRSLLKLTASRSSSIKDDNSVDSAPAIKSAASVITDVGIGFLFVSIWLSINAAVYGINASANSLPDDVWIVPINN